MPRPVKHLRIDASAGVEEVCTTAFRDGTVSPKLEKTSPNHDINLHPSSPTARTSVLLGDTDTAGLSEKTAVNAVPDRVDFLPFTVSGFFSGQRRPGEGATRFPACVSDRLRIISIRSITLPPPFPNAQGQTRTLVDQRSWPFSPQATGNLEVVVEARPRPGQINKHARQIPATGVAKAKVEALFRPKAPAC